MAARLDIKDIVRCKRQGQARSLLQRMPFDLRIDDRVAGSRRFAIGCTARPAGMLDFDPTVDGAALCGQRAKQAKQRNERRGPDAHDGCPHGVSLGFQAPVNPRMLAQVSVHFRLEPAVARLALSIGEDREVVLNFFGRGLINEICEAREEGGQRGADRSG